MTPANSPVLYGFPLSPHVRAARLAFHERDIAHRFEEVPHDQLQSERYLAINPFGKMPALTHDDLALYETPAILVYADGLGTGPSLQPGDLRKRATMWKFIGIAQGQLYPRGVMELVLHRLLAGALGMEADEAKAQSGAAATETHLDVLEAELEQGFLAGPTPSLADLYCGSMLDLVAHTPEGRAAIERRPAVGRWLTTLRARESFEATFPAMLRG